MPRPVLDSIDMTDSLWLDKLNSNFQKLFDAPFPLFQLTGSGGGGGANFTPVFNPTYVSESPSYTFTRISGASNHDAYVHSAAVKSGECYFSFVLNDSSLDSVFSGITFGSTPSPAAFFGDISYWFRFNGSFWSAMQSSTLLQYTSGGAIGDKMELVYSGTSLEFKRNGSVFRTETVSAGQDVYMSSALYSATGSMASTQFYATEPTGGVVFDQDARVFQNCIGVYEGALYYSNGTSWNLLPYEVLDNIAALDTGTATVTTIKDAYNALLADMQLKGWMA